MAEIVVYTAICGGYDILKAHAEQTVACDWVALADEELPLDRGWLISPRMEGKGIGPRLLSRTPKIRPQRFLNLRYRYAVWIDGGVAVIGKTFVEEMVAACKGQPIATFEHPERHCIYDEAAVASKMLKYRTDSDIIGQATAYRAAGYPEQIGLPALTVMVWDLWHERQQEVSEAWWAETERWGTMDQISLPFVLWQRGLWWDTLPGKIWANPWFTSVGHQLWMRDELRVNLGCANDIQPGYVNVDITPRPGVTVVDLRERWPWDDGSVQQLLAADVIEHLPDKIHTMNEMHRVLVPGCTVEIVVPSTDGPGAFQDPTHVSFWNRNSFRYYTAGDPYRERFATAYGIEAAFVVVGERVLETPDGPKVQIKLRKV